MNGRRGSLYNHLTLCSPYISVTLLRHKYPPVEIRGKVIVGEPKQNYGREWGGSRMRQTKKKEVLSYNIYKGQRETMSL